MMNAQLMHMLVIRTVIIHILHTTVHVIMDIYWKLMEETVQVRYEMGIHVLTYYYIYIAQTLMNVLIMFLVVIKSVVILLEVMFVVVSLDSLLVVIIRLVLVSLSLSLMSYNNKQLYIFYN